MKSTLLLFIVLVFSGGIQAQKNIVLNGGFDNNTDFWRGDAATLSPYIKKSGANSGMIVQYVGAEWKGIDQIINLPKNTAAIEFSVWIKAEAIEVQAEAYNTGLMNVELLTAGEQNIRYESVANVTGTNEWVLYKKVVRLPEEAKKIRILLALGKTNGTLFFDDVKAVAMTLEQYNKAMEAAAVKQ
ncbi:carbohydrate binding domain-containing protein [Flavobacterium sp.]|uniref:carbohydrate binding domain-containing protein n=1 Tax=Flavobacterium sp. TaxID=239 RepID=UPI0026195631|nr:carbohydrate binding domain-containing protein [Flavobacterium sp.]